MAGRAYNSRTWEVELGLLEVQGHPWLASLEVSLALRNSVSKRSGRGEGEGKWKEKKRNENSSQEEVTVRVSGIWKAGGQAVCKELWSQEVTSQGIWPRKGKSGDYNLNLSLPLLLQGPHVPPFKKLK